MWTEERPESDWNGKPIIGPPRRPFAERAILESYEVEGLEGEWVSSSNWVELVIPASSAEVTMCFGFCKLHLENGNHEPG